MYRLVTLLSRWVLQFSSPLFLQKIAHYFAVGFFSSLLKCFKMLFLPCLKKAESISAAGTGRSRSGGDLHAE